MLVLARQRMTCCVIVLQGNPYKKIFVQRSRTERILMNSMKLWQRQLEMEYLSNSHIVADQPVTEQDAPPEIQASVTDCA